VQETFKACSLCRETKLVDEFNKKSTSKDGLQNVCRSCSAQISKNHYDNNKEKIKKRTRARERKVRKIAREYIVSKLKNGCIDCGEKDIIVLDFDHLSDKKYSISRMVLECCSLEKIILEIDKCVIRCANCHRRKTAKDFNWWRLDRIE